MNNELCFSAVIAIGSNIKPRVSILASVQLLEKYIRIVSVSKFYETPPVANYKKPKFINGAILIETKYTSEHLKKDVLIRIEKAMGRKQVSEKVNTPRIIDLDIAYFDGHIHRDSLIQGHVAIPLFDFVQKMNIAQSTRDNMRNTIEKMRDIRNTYVLREDITMSIRAMINNNQEDVCV